MRKAALIWAALAACVTAHAQLTLEQCQQLSREHYPEIAQYDLVAQSEQYNIESASRSWIPQISLSAQATWQNAVSSYPEQLKQMLQAQGVSTPGLAQDQYKVALDISQTIWDGGLSKAGKAVAKAEAAEKRLSTDVSIYSIEERINSLFFSILLLDENLSTLTDKKELLDANYSKLESMYRNGSVLKSDLDLVKVEQLSLGQAIEQAEASRSSFAAMLEMFIGEQIGDRTLEKPRMTLVPDIENKRPELQLLDAKNACLDAKEQLLGASLTPKFAFFAQGFYGNPGLDMFKSMTTRDWSWNAILGVRMQWDISSFFTYGADRRKLENARQALSVQRDVFNFNSNLQTGRQNGEIVRMLKALDSDNEIVELRSGIRRIAESQRQNGVIDTATLLQRITEESAAIASRNVHEIELLKTVYELKHTVNR